MVFDGDTPVRLMRKLASILMLTAVAAYESWPPTRASTTTYTRGARRRDPDVGVGRVQDAGLSGANVEVVLEWAALKGRGLFTTTPTR